MSGATSEAFCCQALPDGKLGIPYGKKLDLSVHFFNAHF